MGKLEMKLLTIDFCMPLTRCEILIIFHDIITIILPNCE